MFSLFYRDRNMEVQMTKAAGTRLETLSVMDCLQMCLQVAAGMKYLSFQVNFPLFSIA